MRRYVLLAAIAGGVAYGLARLGRDWTRAELAPLGRLEAVAVSEQMSFYEALRAGVRVATGSPAVKPAGSVQVEVN